MDVLEAIVLVNDMVVDSSSRRNDAWPELDDLSAISSSFYRDTDIAEGYGDSALEMELYRLSIEKTRNLVSSGDLQRQLGFLPSMREIEVLPVIYRDRADFVEKILDSIRSSPKNAGISTELHRQLNGFTQSLNVLPDALQNFALFAFRGFYYQELAHLTSASYMPHSWRSGIIRSQLNRSVSRFADVAIGAGEKVRSKLQAAINDEFGAQVISANFPLIASFVIGQASRRSDLLRTAVEIRDSAKATAFRAWVYEMERRIRNEQDLDKVKQAQDELTTLVRELEVDLGLQRKPTQEMTLTLALPLPLTPSIERTLHVSSPAWVRRVLRRRTHLVFLRELAQESISLPPFVRSYQMLKL
ncbi:hypothetical protein O7605_20570 [Verrucosispora sp. WMMA2121]|uniref:hypothetical protein n=1 Tax=Verrucosispora sp. WMMA2121 TaxID=3015164 RepID=UPI0022B73C04|nr:hypothetical protein [Verrucosispora sp. WMMA2121]MCZ7421897.1 hypothetical protein [Verrucosispora sp. WMMA2121]